MAKIDVKLIGENGNTLNLMGIASREMKKNGLEEESKEMTEKVFQAKSYDEAISIIGDYVNIV